MHDDLLLRHRAVLPAWQSLYYEHPLELVTGQGCHVVDAAGTRYLDFFGGILTTMTGHAIPEIVDAIRAQAGRLAHASTLYLAEPLVALAERIATLKVPTLILWGGQDRLIPPDNAQRFANDIAGSQLVIFDTLGHVPHEEDPAATVAVVKQFLGL